MCLIIFQLCILVETECLLKAFLENSTTINAEKKIVAKNIPDGISGTLGVGEAAVDGDGEADADWEGDGEDDGEEDGESVLELKPGLTELLTSLWVMNSATSPGAG